jgi:hypothetical protein
MSPPVHPTCAGISWWKKTAVVVFVTADHAETGYYHNTLVTDVNTDTFSYPRRWSRDRDQVDGGESIESGYDFSNPAWRFCARADCAWFSPKPKSEGEAR